MHRGGRVAGRARFTSCGVLSTKVTKNALCGASDRSKRGTLVPRSVKCRTDSARRGVSTVDVLAFSSALRCVTTNQPLFQKAGVMRYDPLKKNVVRPFRALFSFVFGLVRGAVHSALTLGSVPFKHFIPKKSVAPIESSFKSTRDGQRTLKKALTSHPMPLLESHPLRCFKRTTSEMPKNVACRHRRNLSDTTDCSKEIAEVLKTYNTSKSRDRLISKLETMKSTAAECIKSLSQRNSTEQPSLTRRELLLCKQEMVQLSKQLSGLTTFRRTPKAAIERSQSVMERPKTATAGETWGTTNGITQRHSARPQSQPSITFIADSLPERAKEAVMKAARSPSDRRVRSESLRMRLKEHEHMVDTLKSKYAALNHPSEGRRQASA